MFFGEKSFFFFLFCFVFLISPHDKNLLLKLGYSCFFFPTVQIRDKNLRNVMNTSNGFHFILFCLCINFRF